MNQSRARELHRINYLTSEMESYYHQASLKLGISDSVSMVLYTIYDSGEDCLLNDIYKKTGISRQTINSAIRTLEAAQVLYLEPYTGRSKRVVLTEKGREYIQNTAARIYRAELRAFDSWSDEEIGEYIRLMTKFADSFRRQLEAL